MQSRHWGPLLSAAGPEVSAWETYIIMTHTYNIYRIRLAHERSLWRFATSSWKVRDRSCPWERTDCCSLTNPNTSEMLSLSPGIDTWQQSAMTRPNRWNQCKRSASSFVHANMKTTTGTYIYVSLSLPPSLPPSLSVSLPLDRPVQES